MRWRKCGSEAEPVLLYLQGAEHRAAVLEGRVLEEGQGRQGEGSEGPEVVSDVVSAPCLRDGRPARPQEHHGRADNPQMGKGAGGANDWPEHDLYPLCRDCHRGLHEKMWTFTKDDEGWVVGTNADGSTFERPVYYDDASPSPAWWTDAKLGEQWENADARHLKTRATIAHVFKARWGWGKGWADRAGDVMGGGAHGTGQQISSRTVRRYANVWDEWKGDWELMRALGSVTVAYAIAGAEDSGKARAIAEKELAAGAKAGQVVALIEGKTDKPGQSERCVCGEGEGCGQVHSKKGD